MKTLVTILWFLVFTKLMLFWLWLWQFKEYHFGRFKAHFETQKFKKIVSSFWRLKYPKFTKKMLVMFTAGLILGVGMFLEFLDFNFFSLEDWEFYLTVLVSLALTPLFVAGLVLVFQIPTVIWRKQILKKARRKIEKFKDLIVIGITGSYGKTSTKEFLYAILKEKFGDKVLKTKEHINAEIGIAQTILGELNENHRVFIAEIGAYERGKIKEVCRMIRPQIGILTGINEQHMSTFGSQENIIKTKYELIESLPKNGLAIFNGNNQYCRELYQKTTIPKEITLSSAADNFSTIVEKLLPWDKENFLMVAKTAQYLETNPQIIDEAAKKIKGSIEIKKGIEDLNIVDSTYSANPHSVISHLDYFKNKGGRKIIIMPCLIELGSSSKEVHYKIGQKIGEVCDLAIITTRDRFKEIKQGALSVGVKPENILFIEKPNQILEKIKRTISPGDVILLESRVPPKLKDNLIKN